MAGRGRPRESPVAGLLVNVIRTLTTSASEEQRQIERNRLQQGYTDTGQVLNTLINKHETDLTECLQTFRYVSDRISENRKRIKNVRSNVSACKSLLHCKRDELKQLWLENAEHDRVLVILQQVEQLRRAVNGWRDAVLNKHYLRAAVLLLQTSSDLDDKLKSIQGLEPLRLKMKSNREELCTCVCDELYRVLYLRPCEELANRVLLKNIDQPGDTLKELDPTEQTACLNASESDEPVLEGDRALEASVNAVDDQSAVQSLAVLVDALATLQRLPDAVQQVQRDVQRGLQRCITQVCLLCHQQQRAAQHYLPGAEEGDAVVGDRQQQQQHDPQRLLVTAIGHIQRVYNSVAVLHRLLLKQIKRARHVYKVDGLPQLYNDEYIYGHIQGCLMSWLDDYLGVSAASSSAALLDVNQQQLTTHNSQAAAVASHSDASLSSYFVKRGVVHTLAKSKKPVLFRYTHTTQNQSLQAQKHQQQGDEQGSLVASLLHVELNPPLLMVDGNVGAVWLCPPAPDNICAVFRPCLKLAADMQRRQSQSTGQDRLSAYLNDYVQKTYLQRISISLKERANEALKAANSYNTVVGAEEQAVLGAPVPVLQSSALTLSLCNYVGSLIQSLPPFAGNLAALWLLVLAEYKQLFVPGSAFVVLYQLYAVSFCCFADPLPGNTSRVYELITRSLRQAPDHMEPCEWRKISAAWAVDDDISRLLKSLPNWIQLVIEPLVGSRTPLSTSADASLLSPQCPASPVIESADDVRARNARESAILIGNLGSQHKIDDWELIFDKKHLSSLAHMHESLEWFASSVRRSLLELPASTLHLLTNAQVQLSLNDASEPETETLFNALERRLTDLEDMAATCLLMLHLEVRVHCFYHLLPLARQSSHVVTASESQEAHVRCVKLSHDLQQLHADLAPQLQTRKVRYIFEGLGHLISSIFIHSAHHISKINDNGKKQMCRNIFSLQQTLSALTGSREPDLDDARRFFELLHKQPDQILNTIVDKEPRFSELEYRDLLTLAVRSQANYAKQHGALEKTLDRLKQIMAEKRAHS